MRISDQDDINHSEAVQVFGIGFMAALRGGRLTSRQKRRIEVLAERARVREDKKRAAGRNR